MTVVIDQDRAPIAQYGHFDGYPSGSGKQILEILLRDREQFIRTQLHRCADIGKAEYDRYRNDYGFDKQSLSNAHRNFWWGDGVELLEQLLDDDSNVEIYSRYELAYDSLQCEWAYVIDYGMNTFEVYKGMNKEPLDPSERFYHGGCKDGNYYPVRLLRQYNLSLLPSVREFLKDCDL